MHQTTLYKMKYIRLPAYKFINQCFSYEPKDMFDLSGDEQEESDEVDLPPPPDDDPPPPSGGSVQATSDDVGGGSQFSLASTQASVGLHFSTPAYIDLNIDTLSFSQQEEIDTINHEEEYQKVKDKLTKRDAKDLIRRLDDHTEAAEEIVNMLIGGQFCDLKSSGDIENAQNVAKKIRGRLYNLSKEMKSRQFRKKVDENLETTFLRKEEYDFLQKSYFSFISNEETDNYVDEDISDEDKIVVETGLKGPNVQRKHFTKPLNKVQNVKYRGERTNQDFNFLKEAAEIQKVELYQYAGYLIQRDNYQKNRKLAKIGTELFTGNLDVLIKPNVSLEECFHILVRNKLDRVKYTNLCSVMHKHVSMIPYYLLSRHKMEICPPLYPYPPGASQEAMTGTFCKLEEALVSQMLRLIRFEGDFLEDLETSCCLKIVAGMDNAGDEKEYQQRSQVQLNTSHVENGSFLLASIHKEIEVVETRQEVYFFHGFEDETSKELNIKLHSFLDTLENELEAGERELGNMLGIEIVSMNESMKIDSPDVIMYPDPFNSNNHVPLPSDIEISATILHVESPSRLFLCPSANLPGLNKFQDTLQSLAKSMATPTELEIGQIVLFLSSEDELWYRGTVLSMFDGRTEVWCPDFGQSDSLSLDNIRQLADDNVAATKYWASLCTLEGWSEEGEDVEVAKELEELAAGLQFSQKL